LSLDLALDDAEQAIADAVAKFCAERCPEAIVREAAGSLPRALWRELAELGVLALATPEGDGGARELCAALESLGAAVFPGPLPATFFATQVLAEKERIRVAQGEWIVALGAPPLLPFAPVADCFLALAGDRVHRAEPRGAITAVETLGGEPWGRVDLELGPPLAADARAWALHDLALAAYAAAAGGALVRATAAHARTRTQFGRAIGEFQAVAHPLADAHVRLEAAATLARIAAHAWDENAADLRARAAAARLSAARAALDAAHTSHQLFGALGITLEGPVFHVSRRIRQLASQPPPSDTARDALLAHWDAVVAQRAQVSRSEPKASEDHRTGDRSPSGGGA
jgi:alkylation response protein AidB-like acyl-CoA dehydrogenase